MSKSLDTLLKIAQRRMDALAIEAATYQRQVEDIQMRRAQVVAREEIELEAARHDLLVLPLLPAYRARIQAETNAMDAHVRNAETLLADVRQRMSLAYQEKAKLEHLIEMQAQRRAKLLAEREQAALDEAALNLSFREG
jgi:hypothetical protein